MAVPMASFATAVTFGGFRSRVASFRVAGVALYVFQHVSYRVKSRFFFLCGRRNAFATSIVISRGRHSTLDVSRRVFFFDLHCQGCVKWRHGANSVAGVAFCEMC